VLSGVLRRERKRGKKEQNNINKKGVEVKK
jgi:hypothetical protein